MTTFPAFLQNLAHNGRAIVAAPRQLTAEEVRAAQTVLVELEEHARLEMPAVPPALDLAATLWGATLFYRACQLAVYRDLDIAAIERAFAEPAPSTRQPSAHYSVDLTLRFLPQLALFAQRAAEQDALVAALNDVGRAWPLSSVGMPAIGVVNVEAIASHPSLLALYVDRIMSAKDVSRLDDERVREAVATALGMHANLAPDVAAQLEKLKSEIIFLAETAPTP